MPKHPRLRFIQHNPTLGRTPSYPMAHYSSSTNIIDATVCHQTVQLESEMDKPLVRQKCYPCFDYSCFE